MSLTRVVLVLIQTTFNELACTPPNPTQTKHRYHTEEPGFFQIAPLILRLHQYLLRGVAGLETLSYLTAAGYKLPLFPTPTLVIRIQTSTTPLFLLGVALVVAGSIFRLAAFRALGELFTFDLTIHPNHRLVTDGPYAYVRHPSYTGTLCIIAGLVASHLGPGSWIWLYAGHSWLLHGLLLAGGTTWWTWMLGVGLSRIPAEEKKMSALFPEQWAAYVRRVPYWFIPGVV
ncbi:hypothetical protein MIND_00640800 [Mycena indigotica]|uniref:Protein-S-isoprenylcysteine O-methyltransferase n=1 Tax=Mycena indigotica TaxID=2126181 RepID=A0A8H6SQQ9_9AGAR|nr:uncharacterized protein MIND_00640800 [Mycena indigotica]KAF7304093.1 hypothetical protein MIND_00640800 [Mycena indigotica]